MNWKYWIILLLILLLGSYLRLSRIDERGILLWDEVSYLNGAKRIKQMVIDSFKGLPPKEINTHKISEMDKNCEATFTKPFHLILILFFSSFLGFNDSTGSITSAFFGIGTIFLVFILGKMMYNLQTGLISGFILSVSSYHLLYSRSGCPDSDSIFFILLGVYFYYLSRIRQDRKKSSLILTGLLCGFVFLCNFRFFLGILVLFLFEISLLIKGEMAKNLRRFFLFGISLTIPLIGWIIISSLFSLLVNKDFSFSYINSLRLIFNYHLVCHTSSLHIDLYRDIFFYPQMLWDLDGGVVFVSLIFGIIMAIKKHTLADILLLSLFGLPLIFWSVVTPKEIIYATGEIIPLRYTRSISIILPFMALLAGNFIAMIPNKNYFKWVKVMLIVTILIIGIDNSLKIIELKSGYREALNYLTNIGCQRYLTTSLSISTCYTDIHLCELPPKRIDQFKRLCLEKGYHYLLVDWYKYFQYPDSIIEIEKTCQPIVILRNNYAQILPILCENYSLDFAKQILKYDPLVGYIKIYDLREFLSKDNTGK